MADTKDIVIRITLDNNGVVQGLGQVSSELKSVKDQASQAESGGLSKLQARFLTLEAQVQLAKEAFNLLKGAASGAIEALARGSEIGDVNAGFEQLTQQAGGLADVFKNDLSNAVAGTIDDFTLQKTAIESMRAGAKPDEIIDLTQAARALAEQTGGDTKESLDQLTLAFESGRTQMLKNKLGVIDIEAAENKLAAQLGVTREQLSKEGQVQAARTALLEAARAKTAEVGEITLDAGDKINQMSSFLENQKNKFLESFAANESVNEALDALNELLQTTDFQPLIDGLLSVISFAGEAATVLANLAKATRDLANPFNDIAVKANEFNARLTGLEKAVTKVTSPSALLKLSKSMKQLAEEINSTGAPTQDAQERFAALSKAVSEAAKKFELVGPPVELMNKNLVDQTKKSADAKKAADELNKKLEEQQKLFEKMNSASGISEYAGKINQVFGLMEDGIVTVERATEEIGKLREEFGKAGGDVRIFDAALGQAGVAVSDRALETAKKTADETEDVWTDTFNTIGSTLVQALGEGLENGFSRDMLPDVFGSVLGDIGNTLLPGVGGDIGNLLGTQIGNFLASFGQDNAGTQARKAADAFFAEIFNADRLTVVVNGELQKIKDLAFSGSDFGSEGFFGIFDGVDEAAKSAFNGVGLSFAALLDDIENLGSNLGAVFANNLGVNLNNLGILIRATGKSAEDLEQSIVDAFLSGELSALEAQTAINGIRKAMEKGIPDAVGAVEDAFGNLKAATAEGGAASVDALQDIGAEALELGLRTLPQAFDKLLQSGRFTAEEIEQLQRALAAFGINTLEQLEDVSDKTAIAILSQLQAENFPFDEVREQISAIREELNQLPETTRRNLIFDVKVNATQSDRDILEQGQIQTPGQGPGL